MLIEWLEFSSRNRCIAFCFLYTTVLQYELLYLNSDSVSSICPPFVQLADYFDQRNAKWSLMILPNKLQVFVRHSLSSTKISMSVCVRKYIFSLDEICVVMWTFLLLLNWKQRRSQNVFAHVTISLNSYSWLLMIDITISYQKGAC